MHHGSFSRPVAGPRRTLLLATLLLAAVVGALLFQAAAFEDRHKDPPREEEQLPDNVARLLDRTHRELSERVRTASFAPLERLLRYARGNSSKFARNVLSTSFARKVLWQIARGKREDCNRLIQQQFERDVLSTGELARAIERSIHELEDSTKAQREGFAARLLVEILRTPEFRDVSADELREVYDEVVRSTRTSAASGGSGPSATGVVSDRAARSIANATATAAITHVITSALGGFVISCIPRPTPSWIEWLVQWRAQKRIQTVTEQELDQLRQELTRKLRQELLRLEEQRHRLREQSTRQLIARLRQRRR